MKTKSQLLTGFCLAALAFAALPSTGHAVLSTNTGYAEVNLVSDIVSNAVFKAQAPGRSASGIEMRRDR